MSSSQIAAHSSGSSIAPALAHPKGAPSPVASEGKIAEAIQAREAAKQARRGKPVGFPNAFKSR